MKRILFILFSFLSIESYSQGNKPQVYSITTQFERIEIVRMVPGTDMLEGLIKIVADKSIKNAVILSGIEMLIVWLVDIWNFLYNEE